MLATLVRNQSCPAAGAAPRACEWYETSYPVSLTLGVAGGGVHEGLPRVRVVELDAGLLAALPPQHAEQAHHQQHADAHLHMNTSSAS